MSTHDTADLQPSHDTLPVAGTIEVDIPADVLWGFFTRARDWPRWNPCFLWVHNERLSLGQRLTWCFRPVHPFYPYVMPAVADIVEVEPGRKVTWEVTALPGFHARHSYLVEDAGNGRSRFGSWEQAMGPSFRAMRDFWLAHFTFVKDMSLEGARLLEAVYEQHGRPFFDLSPAGADVDGLAAAIRRLAAAHPTAAFVPGHGPVARAGDLVRFADDLESLKASVEAVVRRGASADDAVLLIDLSPWSFKKLPVSHRGRLVWTSAESNIRWMYELVKSRARDAGPRPPARSMNGAASVITGAPR